jgi:pantetheine-phosphate adenylyltransferase
LIERQKSTILPCDSPQLMAHKTAGKAVQGILATTGAAGYNNGSFWLRKVGMGHKFVRAIFPGSFDPITNGHLDVVRRGMRLFDELIIAVGRSPVKNQLFTPEERVEMIAELIGDMPGVLVESFEGLTVEYAARRQADVILRGLRSLTDVQYEFQLALTNRAVAGIETIFIMSSEQYGFTSSTLIREVASLGGDLSNLIPANVQRRLEGRFGRQKAEKA